MDTKFTGKDGGQIVPPIDKNLISEIESVKFNEINFKKNDSNIEIIGYEIDSDFVKDSIKNGKIGNSNRKIIKLYLPLYMELLQTSS